MSKLLSDYNDSRASIVSRKELYSDIDINFAVHPVYRDIRPIYDIDSIKQNLKNLLLTNKYERPFQPDVYSGISSLLFENANIFTQIELQTKIEQIIDEYEPRIDEYRVSIIDESEKNSYKVTIHFKTTYNTTAEVVVYLIRVR